MDATGIIAHRRGERSALGNRLRHVLEQRDRLPMQQDPQGINAQAGPDREVDQAEDADHECQDPPRPGATRMLAYTSVRTGTATTLSLRGALKPTMVAMPPNSMATTSPRSSPNDA